MGGSTRIPRLGGALRYKLSALVGEARDKTSMAENDKGRQLRVQNKIHAGLFMRKYDTIYAQSMTSFSEKRKIVTAFHRAGISGKGIRKFIKKMPYIDPEIRRTLTPETTEAFVDRLEGSRASHDNKGVLRFGAALYLLEQRLNHEQVPLTEGDVHILNNAIRILQNNLFNGNIATARGEHAATIAFIANRVAKIEEIAKSPYIQRFDQSRFRALVDAVSIFAESIFKQDVMREMLASKRHELTQSLTELQERRQRIGVEYFAHKRSLSVITERIKSTQNNIRRIELDFKDAADCLEEVGSILQNIPALDPVVHTRVQVVRDFYDATEKNGGPLAVRDALLALTERAQPDFFQAMRKPCDETTADHHRLTSSRDQHNRAIHALQRLLEDQKASEAGPDPNMTPLEEHAYLLNEDQKSKLKRALHLLRSWGESRATGILGIMQAAQEEAWKKRQDLEATQPPPALLEEFEHIQKRVTALQEEVDQLKEASRRANPMREAFEQSKAAIVHKSRPGSYKSPLYLIKTVCIAADLIDQMAPIPIEVSVPPLPRTSTDKIRSYQFLHRGTVTDANRTYADVHYSTTELPFCYMLVQYFRSRPPSSSSKAG